MKLNASGRRAAVLNLDEIKGKELLMQTDTILRRIEKLPALSRAGKRINGLHRLMRSPCLYELAYDKVSRNRGAETPGIDNRTFSGMSPRTFERLARRVAEGTYRPRPVRRVHIPKGNGKTRPLGIPTVEDRLVQEVVRNILEAIYEPVFSERSHGFRIGRSCHTALEEIRNTWTGVKWLIEVDVRGYFDNIDHAILLKLLTRRIDDRQFVGVVEAMLKAGYVENWKFERTYSGTPQGGIVSPLLANIYLHELDVFMQEMISSFNRGVKRRANPAYTLHSRHIAALRVKIDALRAEGADAAEVRACMERMKAVERDRRSIPSVDPMDPGFRRLRYCRYADDFLLGVIGSKAEAQKVLTEIQEFLGDRLKLAVSPEKTGVRDASKGSRFLGYHVCAHTRHTDGTKFRRKREGKSSMCILRRPTRGNIKLWVPMDRVYAFCKRRELGDLDKRNGRLRPQLVDASSAQIIAAYNSEFRGFANYYAIADGVKRSLSLLELVVLRSLFATLASRHRTTVRRIKRALKMGSGYGITRIVRGKMRVHKVWLLKHLELRPWRNAVVDQLTAGTRLVRMTSLDASTSRFARPAGGPDVLSTCTGNLTRHA